MIYFGDKTDSFVFPTVRNLLRHWRCHKSWFNSNSWSSRDV